MAHTLPDNIQAARIRCGHTRPYLSAILYRLVPVAQPGLGTMAVDKFSRLYFDPECKWTVEQYETVLYHEICHLLRDHSGRADAQGITPENHAAWNVCADAEINDDINAEGNTHWPFDVVTPKALKQPDNLFAEEYYANLPKQGCGNHGTPGPGNGQCGSASGAPIPGEQGSPTTANPGLSPAETDAVRHKVASDIAAHVKNAGNVPGHLKVWAELTLNPKVDWRKVLRAHVRHAMADIAGMLNFTYSRPARRAACMPRLILPSMRQPVPQIATVIDSSGSVSDADLSVALGEVASVLRQCGQRDGVSAIVCDAGVGFAKRITDARKIEVIGRSGTDMRVGIAHAGTMKPRPHTVIILTDGHTPWPSEPPRGMGLIAVLIGQGRAKANSVPTFIKVVEVDT